MQFLVLAYDGRDEKVLERRMAGRVAHLTGLERMKALGKALYGAAILNDQEKMIGSVMVCNFASRDELDAWLKVEPYVTAKVWEKIEVMPVRVPPLFMQSKP
jgi:uncharacterized protein YciI